MKALQFRRSHEDSERVGSLGDMVDYATKQDYGLRYEPALLGSDMDPDVTINSFVQTEITEHDGLSRPCLYRSPAVAVPVAHEPKIEPTVIQMMQEVSNLRWTWMLFITQRPLNLEDC